MNICILHRNNEKRIKFKYYNYVNQHSIQKFINKIIINKSSLLNFTAPFETPQPSSSEFFYSVTMSRVVEGL